MVRLDWSVESERFRLVWEEAGSPVAHEPVRKGIGPKLIGMGIRGSRHANLHYAAEGLHATFKAEAALVCAAPAARSADQQSG